MDRLEELIELIYDASLDQSLWGSALIRMCNLFEGTQLILRDLKFDPLEVFDTLSHNRNEAFTEIYNRDYFHSDPYVSHFLKSGIADTGVGSMICTNDLMTEREFRKTELYNNFCKPQDIFDALYAVSDTVEDHNYSVTIQRKESRGEFDKSDRRLTQKLMPHLVRSMRVGSTIRNQNFEKHLLVDTIDSAVGALILVDRNCGVVYVNDNALHLMTNRRDLFLKQKIFQLQDSDADRELQSIVKKACQSGIGKVGGTLSTLRKFDKNNLVLKVIPINQSVANYGNIARECALIMISRMGDYENITPKQLQQTYGLTFAEARLASNLSNGMSIDEFQDRYHVTRNTIKTQLRSCYQKTKTTGQVSLIRLILGQV